MNDTGSTHATLRVNEICDCADVTFDWRHVMTTAVEHKHQKRQSITFLCLCYKIYTKSSQRMNKNDVKIRDEFHFSVVHRSMNAKLMWCPGRHLLCTRPTAFILQCYVLILGPRFYITWKSETQSEKHRRHFDGMHSDMSECGLLFFVHCISTYWQDTTSSNLFYLCVTFLTNII